MNPGADTPWPSAKQLPGPPWILYGLCSLLLLTGCGDSSRRGPSELAIYFTCDTRGRLEPCGCFAGQFGGLTRLKTVLDSAASKDALRVDVGDAIGGREDYDIMGYRYMLRAFAALDYAALNVGHREAQLSAAQLREIKKSSPVPILSANLIDQATGRPIFDSHRVIQRGGFRIAIIGVLDPHGLGDDLGNGLAVTDMESAITRCLAEVRSKADVVVLLAFADEAALTRLAQQFYELHVILGGDVRQPAQALVKENRSLIYFVTNESRALGILRLRLARGAAPQAVANEIQLLHDQIGQDESFRKLVQSYRNEVRHTPIAVDDPAVNSADAVPGVRAAAGYVGTESCAQCHSTAASVWANSGHARAFETLVERNADADPKCIGCHTVGFGSASGYRREFGAEKLVNVGCESCHGPGSLHVRQQTGDASVSFKYRPLDAGDCQKCHHGEFSRPFDWSEFWPPIKHGREPAPHK